MSLWHSLTCTATGVGAVLTGVSLAPGIVPAATAGVVGAVGAKALTDVGTDLLARITQHHVDGAYDSIASRLKASGGVPLPQNLDLLRALRGAQLNALQFVVDSFVREAIRDPEYDREAAERFEREVSGWVKSQHKAARASDFLAELDAASRSRRS